MKIAIFMPNWVGDAVMATPALASLRDGFPTARILGVMRPHIADVLGGAGKLGCAGEIGGDGEIGGAGGIAGFDEALLYSRRSRDELGDTRALLRRLRHERLDQFLLFTNSFSTAWIAWRSGARQRIGFARQGRGWLLTHRLRAPRRNGRYLPRSAVDHYQEVARAAGSPPRSNQLILATLPEDESAADQVWAQFGWQRDQPVVTLNTGAAYGPAKAWPDEYFGALGRRICDELGAAVLVLCGPREREAAARIVRHADHPRLRSLAEQPVSIGLSKACVRRSRLLVSTDSGPRHFAAAFGVPLITLFGPTDPRWSDNYHSEAIDLELDLACRPCAQRVCPLGHHRCLRELTVDRVFDAVQRQFDQSTRRSA